MEIAEIKERLTLAEVLKHYGLKPDKSLRLNCPFHEDKTPSLQIYYKTHTAYCFSSNCKTHGKSLDVIDFIMHKENITKHEAIKQAEVLITGSSQAAISKEAFLGNMFTYFKNAVHNSAPARDYIRQRCLHSPAGGAGGGLEVGNNAYDVHYVNSNSTNLQATTPTPSLDTKALPETGIGNPGSTLANATLGTSSSSSSLAEGANQVGIQQSSLDLSPALFFASTTFSLLNENAKEYRRYKRIKFLLDKNDGETTG